MKQFIVGLVLAACFAQFVYCVNYCSQRGSGCPSDAQIYRLTDSEKTVVLDEHNKVRNAISNGSISGYERCARMGKLIWDDDLAFMAGLATRNCTFVHDKCRRTEKYRYSVQNLGMRGVSNAYPSVISVIQSTVKSWFEEYKNGDMSDIRSFHRLANDQNKEVGHFTQVVWANATAVGCGAMKYKKNGMFWVHLACNYGAGNIKNSATYPTSTRAASGCTTGTDTTYKALCSSKEKFNTQ